MKYFKKLTPSLCSKELDFIYNHCIQYLKNNLIIQKQQKLFYLILHLSFPWLKTRDEAARD